MVFLRPDMGNSKKTKLNNRLSASGVWEKVMTLLGECKGQRILDAPAGSGAFSEGMRGKGAQVISLDIENVAKENNRVQGDLNVSLPFVDKSFDKVTCIEGIEHIENPSFLLREFFRIIKDDGTIIITTPNIISLHSRIKFLLTGSMYWFDDFAISKFGHISPISLFHLKYFCQNTGFGSVEYYFNRNNIWMSILAPFFKIVGVCLNRKYNKKDILAGEILILKVKK